MSVAPAVVNRRWWWNRLSFKLNSVFSLLSIETCWFSYTSNSLNPLELMRKLHKFTHTQNAQTIYSDGFSLREFFTDFTIFLSFYHCNPLVIFIGKAKSINCWIEFSAQKIYDRLLIMSELSFRCTRFFFVSQLTHTLAFSNWSINVFELSLSAHLNIPHSELRSHTDVQLIERIACSQFAIKLFAVLLLHN